MVLTHVSQGSTAMDGNEDTLFSDSVENFLYHMVKIYLDPMAGSDAVTIRVYDWDVVAGSYKLYITKKYGPGALTDVSFYSPPLPAHRFKVTIQQTAGTNRTFNWERLSN